MQLSSINLALVTTAMYKRKPADVGVGNKGYVWCAIVPELSQMFNIICEVSGRWREIDGFHFRWKSAE